MSNVAAIDLGSNSCRLVIADNKGKYLYVDARSAKLAEGMALQGSLTSSAINRTVEILGEFANKMQEYDVKIYRAITTAAVRQASNGKQFVDLVREKNNIDFEIIDEVEEARLNLVGAMGHALGKSKYVCVFDIGGASSEVSIATNEINPKILKTTSIPYGARNSKDKFELSEYKKENADALRSEVKNHIKDFSLPEDCIVIGTSSTPLRLASMIYKQGEYVRENADGLSLNNKQISQAAKVVYNTTQKQRADSLYIGENRSHIFVPAVIILQTIVEELKVDKLTSSLLSAKDAIINELIENPKTISYTKDIQR